MSYLFVYGTLLKSLDNPMSKFLTKHSEVIGEGYFYGKLYDVGDYPAAILSSSKANKVHGTILKVLNPENTFKVLDTYEGVEDNLYVKKSVTTYLKNQELNAWVYIYSQPTEHLKQITTGDYLNP